MEAKHETEPSLGKCITRRKGSADRNYTAFHLSKSLKNGQPQMKPSHVKNSFRQGSINPQLLQPAKAGNKNTSPSTIISGEVAREMR
jgi:hypothetical protein